jgi:DMSO reductase family type II enzyme chaperone
VNANVLEAIEGDEALRAAARSHVYAALCDAISFPDGERLAAIARGELAEALRAAVERAAPELSAGADWAALSEAGAGDHDLAVEYTRLFEVGASGPPCTLYGGLYGDARMKTMEEAVRFYNHFGLTLSEDPRELPDHLTTELEFLHVLAFREAEALAGGADAGAYRRAQRDFVARHPGRWLPELVERLGRARAGRFYVALFTLLARWLAREQRTLTALAGAVPAG